MTLTAWPAMNAGLNGASAVCLGLGFFFIRHGAIQAHRRCMLGAMVSSSLFLASYLTYHSLHRGMTVFQNPPWLRPVYLAILLSHTLLAVVIVPLALGTVYFARRGQFATHRRLARWTWPLWMYVSVTGVLIYFLLYHVNTPT